MTASTPGGRPSVGGTATLGLLLLWLAVPAGISGQSQELARVDRALEEGRFGEARATLEEWLEGGWDQASRGDRQHGLWLRAVLTIDPGMAELDLRRLVVEYPGGRFSDEALLRLAHAARLRRDPAAATEYLEILVRDYPESPHRVEARSLLSRLEDPPAGDRPVPGPDIPADSREAVAATDPPSEPTASEPAPSEPEAAGPYTIQLGAFSTEARAVTLALEVRDAGLDGELEPRVVMLRGSELARVRMGGFATREEAQAFAQEVRELGFDAVVASDRDREEPVR